MRKYTQYVISGGGFFILATLLADAFNLAFNTYLVRVLTFEEYGLVTLINTLWSFVFIFLTSLATTVNHKTAYLSAKVDKEAGVSFYVATLKKCALFSVGLSLVWIVFAPFLSNFFDVDSLFPLLIVAPMIILGTIATINRGFLQGSLAFALVGIIIIVETLAKLISAFFLVALHLQAIVYTAIPFSLVIACLASILFVFSKTKSLKVNHSYAFPKRFFVASLLAGLSTTTFLVLDVVLSKHFLPPVSAGQYAFLALVGKMVFFFGSLLNIFVVTLVSRAEGLQKDPNKTFYKLFTIGIFLTTSVYLGIGLFGYAVIPVLLGTKSLVILPYLSVYALAIAFFTLSNQIVIYHLSRHHYVFPITAISFSGAIIIGIMLFHASIAQIVGVIFTVSILDFITMIVLHILEQRGVYFVRNFVDFLEAFLPLAKEERQKDRRFSILIFNWRDTRHAYAGGAEVYIHEMAKRWAKTGYRVTLFCGNDSQSPRHEVVDGIEIFRRGGFYFVYAWAFVYYLLRLRKWADIIIDAQNGIPFFTPLYVRKPIYCLMFHVHQEFFRQSLSHPMVLIAYFLEKKAMPFIYRNIKFITISQSTKQDMEKLGLGKKGIDIVHPGVNIEKLKPGTKSKNPMILYLGRLKAYKSVHVLIKAIPKIIKKFPTAEFVIAGFGEEEKNLKKLSKQLKITRNIAFLGKVTEEEKIMLYQRAWVFINPSLIEGWGITTIEANACGTPVVASNVPGLQDSVDNPHTGFLVAYGKQDEFAKKITLLLENEALLKKMSQAAIAWAAKFDWQKSAEKSLQILHNI